MGTELSTYETMSVGFTKKECVGNNVYLMDTELSADM